MIDRDSEEIERVVRDCLARAGMDHMVYETDWLPDDRSLFWLGDDLDEFLRLASVAKAELLYLVRLWTVDHQEHPSEHAGQVYEIDVAFLLNDLFHVYRTSTPWSVEYWNGYDDRNRRGEERKGRQAYC
ncbi:hypothetical protein AOA80_10045 [Methanomassiliicoccales archaeon RumEn M1]|jgi:hypothetical protein|nr:hypothetical protein AOA80_10045 [Methanomassiliicoccales archaeon RumEn M1]